MKKLMKIFKNPLFTFIIGGILFSSIVVIAESINSNEVLYDNSNSMTSYDNVQDVLDDVYNIIDHSSLGFSLLTHTANGLSTNLIAGLYRYQGIQDGTHSVDNYICFGTTNKSTCVSDTDKYMYRIIGINPSGQMKLIKKEAFDIAYQWNTSNGVEWPNSSLFAGLNGAYFLTNTTYIPDSNWSDKIIFNNWHYYTSIDKTVSTITERELSAPTVSAKIGLMYIHDYANTLETPAYSNRSWIHLNNNDLAAPEEDEWTITRHNVNKPWCVRSVGDLNYDSWGNDMVYERSIRPVFFLRASERIASGSGTLSDPYILS